MSIVICGIALALQHQPGLAFYQQNARVTGTVVAAHSSRAVAGARVQLVSGRFVLEARTDDAGHFAFPTVLPASYELRVTHKAYLPGAYSQRHIGQEGDRFWLKSGQHLSATIALVRGGVITGQISDENGEPLVDISVRAYKVVPDGDGERLEPAGGRTFATNDIGVYRVSRLEPGRYYISATPLKTDPNGASYAPSWFPSGTNFSQARPLTVLSNQETLGGDFSLRRISLSTLSGHIVTSSGVAAEGAVLKLVPRGDPGPSQEQPRAIADMAGGFMFIAVPPGNYRLLAYLRPNPSSEDGRKTTGTGTASSFEIEGSIEIAETGVSLFGPTAQVDLALKAAGIISGRLQPAIPKGGLVALRIVQSEYDVGQLTRVRLRPDGSFQIRMLPGRYGIGLLHPQGLTLTTHLGSRDLTWEGIEVPPHDLAGILVTTTAAGAVVGRVHNPAQRALAVLAMAADPKHRRIGLDAYHFSKVLANGEFELTGMKPGRYLLTVVIGLSEKSAIARARSLAAGAAKIDIGAGEIKYVNLIGPQ